MTKKFLLYTFAFVSMHFSTQAWQVTNLTSVVYLANTGMAVHNDEMYATVFNGFTASLFKLKSDNTSWDTIPTVGITVPRFLVSTGSRLYLSSVISGVVSSLYFTQDGGKTFEVDTIGLPAGIIEKGLIYGLQYFNGKVIANLGAGGYWLKDTAAVAWKSIDVPTKMNGGVDPVTCLNGSLFSFDNTGTRTLYVSDDYGETWTVQSTDLPAGYSTNRLVGDENSSRLYSAGTWSNNEKYGLYYSDNMGINWTLVENMNKYLGMNAGGTLQLITSIYANGSVIYLALENNKNSSSPDIVGSTTGLSNLAYDTLGLPTSASEGVAGTNFVAYKNKLALQLNAIDIYINDISTEIQEKEIKPDFDVLYPNPGQDFLKIKNAIENLSAKYLIMNTEGRIVLSGQGPINSINITSLPKGIYYLNIIDGAKSGTQKFVKM